jgi:succinate dehydrogenase/fumarate reductase-like Fe-S protein
MYKNRNKNTKNLTALGFAILAVIMILGPLSQTISDNTVFAKSKHKENKADQNNSEKQDSEQGSQCVAGGSIVLSCNNFSSKDQLNTGNSALGQQSGNKGGNSADQNKEQEQNNRQNSQCVSGADAIVSCNNVEFQNLINSGNNALGQK